MKALLYCPKTKPYLYKDRGIEYALSNKKLVDNAFTKFNPINGKIVAECDYEVEEIRKTYDTYLLPTSYYTPSAFFENDFYNKTCLSKKELDNYLKQSNGKAIHVENLHIFDRSIALDRLDKRKWIKNEDMYENEGCDSCINGVCKNCPGHYEWFSVAKAPQNMMIVWHNGVKKVLISIHPEILCKILNGKCTIIIKKKVLKEMLEK